MPESPELLFVYGTLMSGQTALPDWQAQAGATLVGKAKAPGVLYDFGRYPGAIFDPNADAPVHGELYRLEDPDAFRRLDAYEEIDPVDQQRRAFTREVVAVETEDGHMEHAWAYAYRGAILDQPVIAAGNWPEHCRNRRGADDRF